MGSQTSPAKVLYIDNSYSFGGAILSLAELVAQLDETRYRARVVSGQPRASLESWFPSAEVHHLDRKLPWRDNATHTALRSLPGLRSGPGRRLVDRLRAIYWLAAQDLPLALRYASVAKKSGANIVHLNNNLESQFSGILAARFAGLPCVIHSRSFQAPQRALRWHAALASHHIAISTAIRENLLELGIDGSSVSMIHDAVDVESIRADATEGASRTDFGIGEGDLLFGLVGGIVPWKGTLEFVEAATEVIRSVPNARAIVVGDASDGDRGYFRAVRRMVSENGLDDRIILTGYRNDIAAMMSMMDVVVHASTKPEPFGMVLIEAMALGRPVVATHGGGPEDIVAEGVGTLVPRGDTNAMSTAVIQLLRDPERRREMGRRALERARKHFSSSRHAAEVMKLYDHLLDSEWNEKRTGARISA